MSAACVKEIFFFRSSFALRSYSRLLLLQASAASPAVLRSVSSRSTAKGLMSVMPTVRTLKAVLRLAARKAAPTAMASSPFRCTPSSISSPKKARRLSCSLGVRTPPPISSTAWMSSRARPAARRASSTGRAARAKNRSARFSSCERDTCVEKSRSSCSAGMNTGISWLALSTSLTLLACARSLDMARGTARTSFDPSFDSCWLNSRAR
mmetsp:Transcript_2393/g.3210  ORF Transcript_2393/g.3210 Transcript_2393/m.3210 type:complete len:209 (+) Transcript_2393:1281-1907(+)